MCRILTLKATCNVMYKVFQISQGTQEEREKAVAVLSPEKTAAVAAEAIDSPVGWEGGPPPGRKSPWE